MPTSIESKKEIGLEGEQDRGTEWLQIDHPDARPWGEHVDQFNDEETFQKIYDSSAEAWKEQIITEVENQAGDKIDDETKASLIQNAETLIKDELLHMYKALLDQGIKPKEIQGILSAESGPVGDPDSIREATAKQLLIREGLLAGMKESDPSEMMDDEKFKSFVENTAGDHYYDDNDEASILQDKGLLLKGYAASAAVKDTSSSQWHTQRVSDAMSELSYQGDMTATDDKRSERSAVIERKLREYF